MSSLAEFSENPDDLLLGASNTEELRAQRVWRLARVAWMTWLFFAVYCYFRGYQPAAAICFLEVAVIKSVIRIHRGHTNYRRVMNLTLGACAAGLLFVALSEPALHPAMLFYPASILIASQLLGVSAALQWLLVCLIANVVFFWAVYGISAFLEPAHWDELTLICGVSVCIFFCCQQGEAFYRERTKGLVDLSDQLRAKGRRLHQLATTDSLTGLLNRFQFQTVLRETIQHAMQHRQRMALILIDLDGFKEINDTLGHPVGDLALIEVAHRLREEFHDSAIVARLGGDEFCLILREIPSVEYAAEIAQRTAQVLTRRYVIDECEFPMGASVGVAVCPDHTCCDTELLAYADTAMFVAKGKKLDYAIYTEDMTERLVEYRSLQEQLSYALERNEFFLLFQPQVDLATGCLKGAETLLRWQRAGAVISPARFIPLLEKSHEIIEVGRWVIRESCRQLRAWSDAGYSLTISINVSSVQFTDDGFLPCVREAIREFSVDPRCLDFEITESILVDDVGQTVEKLRALKALGATISIDDFGTGYSSLGYLRQFPLDRLKIDRMFIQEIPQNDDGVIASSIIVLAKSLGLKVLAEGVETEAQLEFLKARDCDEYQGYYWSPPVPAEELGKWLRQVALRLPKSRDLTSCVTS